MLPSTFVIKLVKAETKTVYIKDDGSIYPPTAPIQRDGNIYTLTEDADMSIIVQRSFIVINGANHTIHGSGWSEGGLFESVGVFLDRWTRNVTIKNMIIKGFYRGVQLYYNAYYATIFNNIFIDNLDCGIFDDSDIGGSIISCNVVKNSSVGIYLHGSSKNALIGNTIINNTYGLFLHSEASNNFIYENIIKNNTYGIYINGRFDQLYNKLFAPSENKIYHNNLINNTKHAHIRSCPYSNAWDNDYPSGGNYWSDYSGVDEKSGPNQNQPGSDNIGDTPYIIDANNIDHYPLMKPYEIPATPPVQKYILHVQSYPITGIGISYSGDYSGTGITNFDVGPKGAPFTVTLTAPSNYQVYQFDHWDLDGVISRSSIITVKVEEGNRERTAMAVYSLGVKPDFTLSSVQPRYVVLPGEWTICSINVTSIGNFDSPVTLSATSSLDEGINLVLESSTATPPKNGFVIVSLNVSVKPDVKLGEHVVKMIGVSGDILRESQFILEITPLEKMVTITSISATKYNVSYQEESTYVSVLIRNRGSNAHTVTLTASTKSKGWSVSPTSIKIDLPPSIYHKEGFSKGFSIIYLCLEFSSQADYNGNLTIKIEETLEEKVFEMKVYSTTSKYTLIGIHAIQTYIFLPLTYGHLGGLGISGDKKVRQFALDVLKNEGVNENAKTVEKVKAIFNYVIRHMEYERSLLPPTIYSIVNEIEDHGGVSADHRIKGDCKTYSIFFGGLVKALGLDVRLVGGIMEASKDALNMIGHMWVEVKIEGKWVFIDPTNELFNKTYNISKKENNPDNLDLDSFDAKKAYELNFEWGGPLTAIGCEGGFAFDLIKEYKFLAPPRPSGLVIIVHSPVNVYLYDSNWKLIATGSPYKIFWTGPNYALGEGYDEGKYIFLADYLNDYNVKLIGTDSGFYRIDVALMNASTIKFTSFNGTIKEGEESIFKLCILGDGEVSISTLKQEEAFNIILLAAIGVIIVVLCSIIYLIVKKKLKSDIIKIKIFKSL
jgi:parallel beta-helix repeat protein